EEQVRGWFEQIELLFEQQRVRAKRDELLPLDEAAHNFADLLVNQRLAAGNCHHRRAALVGGVPAFLCRHSAIQDRIRVVDLAATDAGQIAPKQRLQHKDKRIAFSAKQLLLDEITANAQFLEEGYCHYKFAF